MSYTMRALTRASGLNARTIHYYESLGLISALPRAEHQHRHFPAETLLRLEKIQALKGMGLSLDEIGTVIDAYFNGDTMRAGKEQVIGILEQHLQQVDDQLAVMTQHRADIQANIDRLKRLAAEL